KPKQSAQTQKPTQPASEPMPKPKQAVQTPQQKHAQAVKPLFVPRTGAVESLDVTALTTMRTVGPGTVLYSAAGRPVTLTQELGAGGEGRVYRTDSGLVCKVYSEKPPTIATRQKLELMCSRQVSYPGICWPRELVFDATGAFAGYTMPMAAGTPLK